MHRKNVRRWHKLLSVSGILVAIFGTFYIPMANAAIGAPTPDGIYGIPYSNGATQTQYIDFPSDVNGLEANDFYFTGTAIGCTLNPIPAVLAFSFSVTVSNCSDGTYALNLKANSVSYPNGNIGPATDFHGDPAEINRTIPTMQFQNLLTTTNSHRIEWELAVNHKTKPNAPYDIVITGDGCELAAAITTNYGMMFAVDGCAFGTKAQFTVKPNTIMDVYGNLGPKDAVTSPLLAVIEPTPAPTVTPTASPTASPTTTVSPTASPTATPSATPSASPTPSDLPASVAVVIPPTEPPTPPTVVLQEPITPLVSDPIPQDIEPEPAVGLPPIAVVRSKIIQVRKQVPVKVQVPVLVEEIAEPVVVAKPAPIVQPVMEVTAEPTFNWQPIGYLALAVGGAAAAVGGGLLLQRIVKVRRLKFS